MKKVIHEIGKSPIEVTLDAQEEAEVLQYWTDNEKTPTDLAKEKARRDLEQNSASLADIVEELTNVLVAKGVVAPSDFSASFNTLLSERSDLKTTLNS